MILWWDHWALVTHDLTNFDLGCFFWGVLDTSSGGDSFTCFRSPLAVGTAEIIQDLSYSKTSQEHVLLLSLSCPSFFCDSSTLLKGFAFATSLPVYDQSAHSRLGVCRGPLTLG